MNPSTNQVVRMLAMVPYLQSHEGIPVRDLAREFGVTDRQIRKDLKLLMFTGVGELPGELIDVDLSALEDDGVVFIRDAEFLSRPLRISRDEGLALVIALRALRSTAGDNTEAIDGALAKLETAIGATSDEIAAPADVLATTVDIGLRRTIVDAIDQRHVLHLSYSTEARDAHTERDVEPLRLSIHEGEHYLSAWCRLVEDHRIFRLDRIVDLADTGQTFEPRDAGPALEPRLFTPGPDTPSAVIDIAPSAAWMAEYYRVDVEDERPDGSLRARVYGTDEVWLRRLVLRHGGAVKVVEPAALRSDVAVNARAALQAYDETN